MPDEKGHSLVELTIVLFIAAVVGMVLMQGEDKRIAQESERRAHDEAEQVVKQLIAALEKDVLYRSVDAKQVCDDGHCSKICIDTMDAQTLHYRACYETVCQNVPSGAMGGSLRSTAKSLNKFINGLDASSCFKMKICGSVEYPQVEIQYTHTSSGEFSPKYRKPLLANMDLKKLAVPDWKHMIQESNKLSGPLAVSTCVRPAHEGSLAVHGIFEAIYMTDKGYKVVSDKRFILNQRVSDGLEVLPNE